MSWSWNGLKVIHLWFWEDSVHLIVKIALDQVLQPRLHKIHGGKFSSVSTNLCVCAFTSQCNLTVFKSITEQCVIVSLIFSDTGTQGVSRSQYQSLLHKMKTFWYFMVNFQKCKWFSRNLFLKVGPNDQTYF